ncbi:ATP-binding protein [Streptomyces sp. NPDC003470]
MSTDEHVPLCYGEAWGQGAARAADARRALRVFLDHAPDAGRATVPADVAMDAELATSELVTNALRHAPGPCGMNLRLSGDLLTITVWDSSTGAPAARKADPRRIGGHGLHLVHTVSAGVAVAFRATGKLITAHLSLAPRHAGGTASPAVPSH